MSRLSKFVKSALLLGAVSVFMRTVSVVFNAYIAANIGADGMGLFSLINSVYIFAVTLAGSGINLAVTRLVTEAMAKNCDGGIIRAVKKCVVYALCFGGGAAILLSAFSDVIATKAIGDPEVSMCFRTLSAALPFIAVSNVFSGYFYAVRRSSKSALSGVFEQFVKIAVTVFFLGRLCPLGTEFACLALVLGMSISEGLSFSYLLLFYLADRKKHLHPSLCDSSSCGSVVSIALPIMLSSCLRSGLVTIEHILIPRGLEKFGTGRAESLSAYGTVSGMAMPVLLFPSALCAVFSSLIIPELSELSAKSDKIKDDKEICYMVKRACGAALIFGIGTAGMFICFSEPLGLLIYKSADAAKYIGILAPLVPLMYLDMTVDGMLKGLGQQLYCMRVNILDAAVSILLISLLLPEWGITGYIACIYITETMNVALSVGRLLHITGARLMIGRRVILPLVCIAGACSVSTLLIFPMNPPPVFSAILGIGLCIVLYLFFLFATSALSTEDARWIKKLTSLR